MLTVLDVGVRGGPHPRWFPFADRVRLVGVDADADECARLAARRLPVPVTYLPYALGARDGEQATLHVTQQPGCSSLLRPNTRFLRAFPYGPQFHVVRTIPLTLTCLDTLCARHAFQPDVLKIDVQGYELAVLRGARTALASVSVVELEVEFNPIYENQPLFGDVDAEMRSHGFTLLGLRRTAWRRHFTGPSAGGTIMHGDALYVREPAEADALERFILSLKAYRQFDYVRSLDATLNGASPARTVVQRLIGALSRAWPSHRHVRGFVDAARPDGAQDWHDPEFC